MRVAHGALSTYNLIKFFITISPSLWLSLIWNALSDTVIVAAMDSTLLTALV